MTLMDFTVLMHLIFPYPRYGFNGVYGTVLVPRKPRIARVRLSNGVVIDIYSEEVLWRLLDALKTEPVKVHKADKPVEAVETVKPSQDTSQDKVPVDSGADFVANNPWLAIIAKRGTE
jgi:hypothetical protein